MNTEETRKLVSDWMSGVETLGARGAIETYCSTDVISHNPTLVGGHDPGVAYLEDEAARGSKVTIHRIIADGNFAAVHMEMTFTDGSPALAIVDLWRAENGKLVELWDVPQPIPAVTASGNSMF